MVYFSVVDQVLPARFLLLELHSTQLKCDSMRCINLALQRIKFLINFWTSLCWFFVLLGQSKTSTCGREEFDWPRGLKMSRSLESTRVQKFSPSFELSCVLIEFEPVQIFDRSTRFSLVSARLTAMIVDEG